MWVHVGVLFASITVGLGAGVLLALLAYTALGTASWLRRLR